mmetsp:Transcript_111714/g.266512  ORF Transcript_111714/g.266512 Transcript_111714/m.266512 type:complete len:270 (-) Transcript_111714:494-1303(-)
MHPPSLLCHVHSQSQLLVDSLHSPPFPAALNARGISHSLELLGILPTSQTFSPRLDSNHLLEQRPIPLARKKLAAKALDPCRSAFFPLLHEVALRLLAPKDGLQVPSEEANSLVLVHLHMPSPSGLNLCGALHHQLQASELDALEGGKLEEDHRLSHGPRLAVLWLWEVQLLVQVVQELLGANFRILQVPELGDHLLRPNDLVVVPAVLVVHAHRVAGSAHLNHLQHAAIAQLLRDALAVKEVRHVLWIRLDTSDEVGLSQVHNIHQAR